MDDWTELADLLRRRGTALRGNEPLDRQIQARFAGRRAILALDSSGFTRRVRQHGIVPYLALVVRMRDMAAEIARRFGADQVWAYADNYFCSFPAGAAPALDAALEIHRAMQERNQGAPPEEHLRVCIAVGVGELLQAGSEGVFGDEMNVTCRLAEDVAGPDETLVTCSAFAELRDRSDVAFEKRELDISGVHFDYYAATPVPDVHSPPLASGGC